MGQVYKEHEFRSVASVMSEIGEVAGIVDSHLTDCRKWAAGMTEVLRGSELRSERLPAVTMCDSCGRPHGTDERGRICPYCGSEDARMASRNDVTTGESKPASVSESSMAAGLAPRGCFRRRHSAAADYAAMFRSETLVCVGPAEWQERTGDGMIFTYPTLIYS